MNYLKKAYELIDKINSYGHEAYIIGGAVRDYLLKKNINDIDITTSMSCTELLKHFSCYDSGSIYLSVTIIYEGYYFEVTTFRTDVEYIDFRHPIIKEAQTLKEDTKRRDFTINALAMTEKEIIDYYNGIDDLNNKIIKAIGDPIKRFNEDALRILRACYFSSKLGFNIDENTLNAMIACKKNLLYLSDERITDYVFRIIYSDNQNGLNYINKYDLFEYISNYKKAINLFSNSLNKEENYILYFIKYKEELPLMPKSAKKSAIILDKLINEGFNLYNLFLYKEEIKLLANVIKHLGYDIDEILFKLDNLLIKDYLDLKVSKALISTMFTGNMIAYAIKRVIQEILEGNIKNDINEIVHFLEGIR